MRRIKQVSAPKPASGWIISHKNPRAWIYHGEEWHGRRRPWMERRTRVSVYGGGEGGGITPETTENINQVNFTRGCTLGFRVWRESTNMGRVLSSLLVVLSSSSYRFQPSVKCSIPRRIFRRAAPLGRRGIKLRLGGSRCGSTRYRTEGMELKSGWGRSWVFLLFLFSYFFYLSILRVNVMGGEFGMGRRDFFEGWSKCKSKEMRKVYRGYDNWFDREIYVFLILRGINLLKLLLEFVNNSKSFQVIL